MVLSKSELIAALQSEVQILLHLASKIDRTQLDYRPTPKQRSTIELLRYLSLMGPMMLELTVTGTTLDPATAKAAIDGAAARDFDQTLAVIAKHKDTYESLLAGVSDEDFQKDIDLLGNRTTRGAYIIKWILCGCAMYRTQLFLYLKACGREELTSMNLFMGVDAPAAV
jgi:hypothetical protein